MPVNVVTLLVNPEEAERLTLAASEGKIQLALRNPLDRSAPADPRRRARPSLLGTRTCQRASCRRPRAAATVARAASARKCRRPRLRSSAATSARTKSCAEQEPLTMNFRQQDSYWTGAGILLVALASDRIDRLGPVAGAVGQRGRGAESPPRGGRRRHRPERGAPAGRPLDRARRRHADRPRVADQR